MLAAQLLTLKTWIDSHSLLIPMKLLLILEEKIKALLNKVESLEGKILELEEDRDEHKQLLEMALQDLEK